MVMYAGRIVESGRLRVRHAGPQAPVHPACWSRSAPDPTTSESRARGARGEAPSLVAPSGVPVQPRCPFATDVCRTEVPPLMPVGEGREAACWGYADREDRPALLDAYGERPTVDVSC